MLKTKRPLWFCYILLLTVLAFIGACSNSFAPMTRATTHKSNIKNKNSNAIYLKRAKEKLSLADKYEATNPQLATSYKIEAAENYILGNYLPEAEMVLLDLEKLNLNTTTENKKSLLLAQVNILNNRPSEALTILDNIWSPKNLPQELEKDFYIIRSKSRLLLGDNVQATEDLITLSSLLQGQEQELNIATIWHVISELPQETLLNMEEQSNNLDLKGWASFAYIRKSHETNTEEMLNATRLWQKAYPRHQANSLIQHDIKTAKTTDSVSTSLEETNIPLVEHPKKIGLILPMSGTYKSSATAIKEGFIAAHFNETINKDTVIKFYDSSKQNIKEILNLAKEDQIEFIIGPLLKHEIDELYNLNLEIPTLALNTTNAFTHIKPNLYFFGLPPEHEAYNIVKKAMELNYHNAAIIIPANQWGQRFSKAFKEQWSHHGKVINEVQILEKQDLNKVVKDLLFITASEKRSQQLKALGLKFKPLPTTRTDLDVIILATNAAMARQIKPLLAFYYAKDVPILAGSSVFEGVENSQKDRDLDGIKFCDMPWIVNQEAKNSKLYAFLNTAKKDFKNNTRFYALGVDAYKIMINLKNMVHAPNLDIRGATGVLSIDSGQRVVRQLTWASFKNGIIHQPNNIAETLLPASNDN